MKVDVEMYPQYSTRYLSHCDRINPVESIQKMIAYNLSNDFSEEHRLLALELAKQSIDALVYACLEYAKYPRPYSQQERMEYLLDKCQEFNGMLEPYHMAE